MRRLQILLFGVPVRYMPLRWSFDGPADADIIWRFDMTTLPVFPHDAAASSACCVRGDVVYVGRRNGVDNKSRPFPSPSLIALDKRTGRLLAGTRRYRHAASFTANGRRLRWGWCGPRPLVFFGGGDGVCYAFDAIVRPAGPGSAENLVLDCTAPYRRSSDGKPIDYWFGDRRKHRGNLDDGRFVSPLRDHRHAGLLPNRVYVAIGQDPQHGRGRGLLTCIDAASWGDITARGTIWSYDKIDRSLSTVAIAGGLVFAADMPGRVHCLDAETGHCYWVHDCQSEIWGSPLAVDGKLFVGTSKSLWVLAAGRQPRVLACMRLGSPIRACRWPPTACCTSPRNGIFGPSQSRRGTCSWPPAGPDGNSHQTRRSKGDSPNFVERKVGQSPT